METKTRKVVKYPVVEVFGPTIQGEGALIGTPVMFVRLGYCDYRCSWCDSKFAVEPDRVSAEARQLTARETLNELRFLTPDNRTRPWWVVLSGGNPALHDCASLLDELQDRAGLKVSVETQGTIWRNWLNRCDRVTISPKPPSSGNVTSYSTFERFYNRLDRNVPRDIKIVVFNDDDLEYAKEFIRTHREEEPAYMSYAAGFFLSVGNDLNNDDEGSLLARTAWLVDRALEDQDLIEARVLPQLHVLLWGNVRGV